MAIGVPNPSLLLIASTVFWIGAYVTATVADTGRTTLIVAFAVTHGVAMTLSHG